MSWVLHCTCWMTLHLDRLAARWRGPAPTSWPGSWPQQNPSPHQLPPCIRNKCVLLYCTQDWASLAWTKFVKKICTRVVHRAESHKMVSLDIHTQPLILPHTHTLTVHPPHPHPPTHTHTHSQSPRGPECNGCNLRGRHTLEAEVGLETSWHLYGVCFAL